MNDRIVIMPISIIITIITIIIIINIDRVVGKEESIQEDIQKIAVKVKFGNQITVAVE
jgi:hypothetical protein